MIDFKNPNLEIIPNKFIKKLIDNTNMLRTTKKQRKQNKKRTKWCVSKLVPVVGLEPTTY